MFLVVRTNNGRQTFAKEDIDPRSRMGYKEDSQFIDEIVPLTPKGDAASSAVLKAAWLEGLFKGPSAYKEKPRPKLPPPAKPPKEMLGPKE